MTGVPASPSGHEASPSAADASSQSRVPNAVRIAIVRSMDGHVTAAGPHDGGKDHRDAMDAALCWHLEAGHIPVASYWLTAELPPLPTVPELRAMAKAREFPQSFVDDMDEGYFEAVAASGIEAATADETQSGSAEGESPARKAGDAQ